MKSREPVAVDGVVIGLRSMWRLRGYLTVAAPYP